MEEENKEQELSSSEFGGVASGVNESQPKRVSSRRKKKGKPIFAIIIIIVILLLLGGGAWFLLKEPEIETSTNDVVDSSLTAPEVVDKPTDTPIPTPTPEDVDKDEISIQLLNGTGIAGEAGFLKGELEDLDFSDIDAGNADDQDQSATSVTFSSKLSKTVTDEITEKLEDLYESVKVKKSSSLDGYDVVVIVGLRKDQEKPTTVPTAVEDPTPTPSEIETPTPTP